MNDRVFSKKNSGPRLIHKAYSPIFLEFSHPKQLKASPAAATKGKTGRFRAFFHGKSGCKPRRMSGDSSCIRIKLQIHPEIDAGMAPGAVEHKALFFRGAEPGFEQGGPVGNFLSLGICLAMRQGVWGHGRLQCFGYPHHAPTGIAISACWHRTRLCALQ